MAAQNNTIKKKPVAKTVLMGLISVALYAILLTKQDLIIQYVGRGSLYAFLPITMAFLFSYVHGTFTGNFWTVLGIEASKKKGVK